VAEFIRIGVDLAKNYFQIHALSSEGAPDIKRKVTRRKMGEFFLQIAPCRVGMEASGSAHYWARELKAMGHNVLLMPPAYTKPYVKRGKNDAVDAEAICEAVSRPGMRFVPIKSADQQATLMLHETRDFLVKQRTMSVNAVRSHLAEFGIVVAKGIGRVVELLDLAEEDATLSNATAMAVKVLGRQIEALEKGLEDLEKEITKAHARSDDEPFAQRDTGHRQTRRLCDRSQRAGPKRIQISISQRGSASRRGKTQAAANRLLGPSPRRAIGI
jgi:transposase